MAIVGILAVLAVTSYRKYIVHSKITEAQAMISAIRIAQEDHRSEAGAYADINQGASGSYCPTGAPVYLTKWGWSTSCGGTTKFSALAVHVDGPVEFGYATNAGTTGLPTKPTDASWVDVTNASTTRPWYFVVAKGDLAPGTEMTTLVGTSFSNQIWTMYDGE